MTWQTTMHEAWNLFDNFPLRFISVSRPKHHQAWGLRTDCYLVAFGMIYDVQHVSTSYFTLKFVTYTSPLVVISKLMCEVAHMSMTPLSYKVAVCWDGEWSGQCKNSVLQSTLPAHHPPSSSHPVAICSDAGQRNRRRIGVDQTTPQREGEQGGARQGVACHSTSSTGQYRTAWATLSPPPAHSLHAEGSPPPNSNPAVTELVDKLRYLKWDTYLFTSYCLNILTERQSFVLYTVYILLGLSQLELVLRSGVAKSYSSVVVSDVLL